jgi:AcrR family transcriptional regulator
VGTPAKRINGQETMEKVLEFASQELDEVGAVKFNILNVINKSGVSRSSVYHHFGDRDGVIGAVELTRLFQEVSQLNDSIRFVTENATSAPDVLELIRAVLVEAGSPDGVQMRSRRIALLAISQNIPLMAEKLSKCIGEGDAHIADSLRIAEKRGITKPLANPEGIAHLISSLFLGRSMVDVIHSPSADSDWIDVVMTVFKGLFSPN